MKGKRFCIEVQLFLFLFLLSAIAHADGAVSCAPPSAKNFVSYSVEPSFVDGHLTLKVDLTFRFDNRSTLDLVLPSDWQGVTEIYRHIHDLKAVSAGTSIGSSSGPARRRVSFERSKPVRLEYVFASETPNLDQNTLFGPVVNPNFFVLTGGNFLVYPDVPENNSMPVSFEWKNFPADWTLADSIGVNESCQEANSLLKLSNGLFVGGDFRLKKVPLPGHPAYVAIRGKWQFTDEAFAEVAAKLIAAEREFWMDGGSVRYLVALVQMDAPEGEYAGTALEDSFLMFMSPGTQLGLDVNFLFAHEMFHTWNPAQLGEIDPLKPVYWFTEGFTDYYARLLLFRAGLIDRQQYAQEVNRAYSDYVSSPARNYGEQAVQTQYFKNPSAQRLPYLQGSLLALKWNALAVEHSHGRQSLDDAMRALRKKAQATELRISDQSLASFFSGFTGTDVASDLQNYVGLGKTLPLPTSALGSCFRLKKNVFYTFDAGFDVEAIYHGGVIRGVKPESQAYKAGLRNGQSVLRSSAINPNDPNQTIEMAVIESGQAKVVRYYPRGTASEIDQYEFTSDSTDPLCEKPASP